MPKQTMVPRAKGQAAGRGAGRTIPLAQRMGFTDAQMEQAWANAELLSETLKGHANAQEVLKQVLTGQLTSASSGEASDVGGAVKAIMAEMAADKLEARLLAQAKKDLPGDLPSVEEVDEDPWSDAPEEAVPKEEKEANAQVMTGEKTEPEATEAESPEASLKSDEAWQEVQPAQVTPRTKEAEQLAAWVAAKEAAQHLKVSQAVAQAAADKKE